MVESMKLFYFSSILILGFIIIHTHGQDQTTMKETINDSTPVITVEQLRISSTEESTTIITEITPFTVSRTSTTIGKTTTITTPLPVYARSIPPLNPTWIIVGGFAGGLTVLGLLSVIGGVYKCYQNSRPRVESESDTSTDQDNIPLYIVSSF